MSMNATYGDMAPATTSALSASLIASRYMVMRSQANMPTMIPTRTSMARRRSAIHAPTVYRPMNIAMLPT
ncbi:hypothetical protein [Microbacterium sp. W4I20]|uniref:hypothetical protein n=1 Tax=Microbacterium sp. W4I20 TaxID=3042262 RepID=UPI00278A6165|nr:hypothetical protein [Microbacterium sp. W4I20]MDQ0728049.1 hypothetical protein [Microbacterium sp. W4I20]